MVGLFYKSFSEFTDTAAEGAFHLLEGMAIVFAALALLWGAIELFRLIFTKVISKKKPAAAAEAPAQAPVEAGEGAPTNDEEIAAAISAAIAVCLDKPQNSFRVVSFKRRDNGAGWNK